MLKLPKDYISVSQINLWKSDPINYMKKYFMNIADEVTPFMDFGKQFAMDIEDYSKGITRPYNFPEGFTERTHLYPLVEYKLEHKFDGYTFLGYADNLSDDFETLIDFKTGMAAWSQKRLEDSLQMNVYSAVIYLQKNVIPLCVIDYYQTKLKGSKVLFTGLHERFTHTFEYNELVQCVEQMDNVTKEIAQAYDIYLNEKISDVMENYADILYREKLISREKDEAKKEVEALLSGSKYVKQFGDKIIRYTTVQRKSYKFSEELEKNEAILEFQKKQEIDYGVAQEEIKTHSMISLSDVK